MFGRLLGFLRKDSVAKASEEEEKKATDFRKSSIIDSALAIGFDEDGMVGHLQIKDLTHVGMFGSSGYGKTTMFDLFAYELARLEYGCLIMDPHGGLAKDAVAIMEGMGIKDYVVLAPRLVLELGKTVKMNPLADMDYDTINVFVDQLQHIYKASWGERLEAIIRHTILSLRQLQKFDEDSGKMIPPVHLTIANVRDFIMDENVRERHVNQLAPDSSAFWTQAFPGYSKEAGPAAYNKLDRILSNPNIRAMLDVTYTKDEGLDSIYAGQLNLVDAIRQNKKVIVDLSGIDQGTASFMGALVLMMFFSAVRSLPERIENRSVKPYFLLVDEVQYFAPVLRELLNMFRKYQVKIVMATQSLHEKVLPFADEIIELTSTLMCFRMGKKSFHLIEDLMPTDVNFSNLEPFKYGLYSKGKPVKRGIMNIDRIPFPPGLDPQTMDGMKRVEEIIRQKILQDGTEIDTSRYQPQPRDELSDLELDPIEHAVVTWLYMHGNAAPRAQVYTDVIDYMAPADPDVVEARDVKDAVTKLFGLGYIGFGNKDVNAPGHDGTDANTVYLTKGAIERFFNHAAKGPRGGGEEHNVTVQQIALAMQEKNHYVVVDLADEGKGKPDVLCIPPVEFGDRMVWNTPQAFAIEVESMQGTKAEQIVKNYRKNSNKGYHVVFVVGDEAGKERITKILTTIGIEPGRETYTFWMKSDLPVPSVWYHQRRARAASAEPEPEPKVPTTVTVVQQKTEESPQVPKDVVTAAEAVISDKKLEDMINAGLFVVEELEEKVSRATTSTSTTTTTTTSKDDIDALIESLRQSPKDQQLLDSIKKLGVSIKPIEGGRKWRLRNTAMHIDTEVTIERKKRGGE